MANLRWFMYNPVIATVGINGMAMIATTTIAVDVATARVMPPFITSVNLV